MSDLEQIEAAILSLPSSEFEKLRLWFLDLDYERWDEQIEQDIEDGKLEALAQEAITEFDAGHLTFTGLDRGAIVTNWSRERSQILKPN
ncbi:hypothetical protein [Nostoc sp. FACHB-280]|uniref:hypothetical protein n=1 Tax=Nostoc sp. FACHB-280 TaxID=2692839 RepID=UPI00168AF293|nr:hypothetical protein [Nostoc sp. FACHB-280]MBD2498757.1 hypothetical protein [Nostoc sp. FACHB-280]